MWCWRGVTRIIRSFGDLPAADFDRVDDDGRDDDDGMKCASHEAS